MKDNINKVDKEKKLKEEWKLARRSYEKKKYIDELFHLYHCLKNIDPNNTKDIIRINDMRKSAFYFLQLPELEFLVSVNEEKISYEKKYVNEDLLKKVSPNDLITHYQLEMLYNYEDNIYNEYKLFDSLRSQNKGKEISFWVDYLLKFNPKSRDVIFHGMIELVNLGQLKEAIQLGNTVSDDSYIEIAKLYCLNRLKKYKDILNNIDGIKVNKIAKQEYKMQALVGLYKKNKKQYESELKKQYIEGFNISEPLYKINYLASSPYIAKYLDTSKTAIYHYTDINALKNIIEQNHFWATKNDFLNDFKEHEFIIKLSNNMDIENQLVKGKILKALNRYFSTINNEITHEDCDDRLNTFIDETIKNLYMDHIYVLSFSTNPDNLTLWGNYSHFEGYNLGFNKETLVESMKINNINKEQDYILEGKVLYLDEIEKDTFLSSMVSEIIEDMNNSGVDQDTVIEIAVAHLLFMSNFIKNKSMEAEHEYRIISIQLKHNEDDIVQRERHLRIKGNSLVPYTIINGKINKSLRCINIGPTNNMDISEKGINYLLTANGYKLEDIPVIKSKITLRY